MIQYADLPMDLADALVLLAEELEVTGALSLPIDAICTRSQAPAWECIPGSSSFQSREAGAWRPEDSFGYNEGDVVNFPGTDTRFSF